MSDISHYFGSDLSLSASGDLLTVAQGAGLTKQRILRRLLTPQGGYIWELPYGAGLPALIGQPVTPMAIQNAVRAQIFNEATVAKAPEPVITVTATTGGTFTVTIAYTDAVSGQPQILTVT
ncbi:MAG TPA: hypothetical protein PK677_14295 [Acidiphilium sp.]|nr:hypothetical protein [Acidiphilium sp.]